MRKSFFKLAILSAPLLLTACGEGWEMQRISENAPYSMERTAGRGVSYVRAKMMPEKALNLEISVEEVASVPVMNEVTPVIDAEKIFTKAQSKGLMIRNKVITPKIEGNNALPKIDEKAKEEGAVENTDEEASISDPVIKSSELYVPKLKLTAEQYIAQAPRQIEIPGVEIRDAQSEFDLEIQTISVNEAIPEIYADEIGSYDEALIEPSAGGMPVNEIMTPKTDIYNFISDGQVSLDEIYNDPF